MSSRILRPRNVAVLVVLAALGSATGVFAWWHAGGAGTASASLSTLGSPAPVHASSPSTGEADVDWSAVSSPSGLGSDVTYTVERSTDGSSWTSVSSDGANTCSGSLSQATTSCVDHPANAGDYYYRVTATFKSSWTSMAQTAATVHVVTDVTPPTSSASLGPTPNANGWNNQSVLVTLNATDNPGGTGVKSITYAATGAQPITSTTVNASSTSFTISAEGTTTIAYHATDNAANVESPENTQLVKIDTTAPTIAVGHTADGSNGWNKTSPVGVSVAVSDAGSGVAAKPTCRVDGVSTAVSGAQSPYSVSVTGDGTHAVSCSVSDNAGNSNTGTDSVNLDATPPSITVSHTADGANGWNKTSPASVSVAVSDTTSSLAGKPTCTVDGSAAAVAGSTSPYSVSVSGNGTHPVVCTVSDNAGNINSGNDSVKIDTTGPSGTALTTSPAANGNGWINTTPVTVTLSGATDNSGGSGVALVKYTTDGTDPTTSGTSHTYNASSKPTVSATTTFKYAAQDAAGNWETVHTGTVQVDTVAPGGTALTTSPAANGNGWINATPVTVTLSGATDNSGGSGVALVKYTTDGTDPTSSGTAQTYNAGAKPAVSATTTFKYAAQDAAGNWETVHTTTVQIDTAPPTGGTFTVAGAVSTAGGATATLNNSTSFTISARSDYTDAGSGLASSVLTVQSESLTSAGCGALGSGGPFTTPQTIAGTTQPTGIVAGACYVYVLTGTDKAGNTASVSVTVVDNSVSFQVTAQPTSVNAGQATTGHAVSIKAIRNGATDTAYTGATLTWSGANNSPSGTTPTLPTSPTWTSGIASFDITLVKAETETLSVSDGTRSSGNFAPITVTAGTASNLAFTNVSKSAGTLSSPCYFTCTDTALGNNGTFTANISVTDSLGNIVSALGSGHTVTMSIPTNTSGGKYTAPTNNSSTETLTISSTGPATSTAQFTYMSGNGSWTSDVLRAATASGTVYTTATATVTKQ